MSLPASVAIVFSRANPQGRASSFRCGFSGYLQHAEGLATRFEALLERHVLLCWVEFTVAYFMWAISNSHRKQLWFGELVSYLSSQLPGWHSDPSLFSLANRALTALLGSSPDILRLGSMIGFWAACLSVFLILRRNHSVAASWVGAIIPVCSGASYFATEASPHGVILGLAGWAGFCWLNAAESRQEPRAAFRWRIGLTAALACAICCDFFALFLMALFLAAEVLRSIRRWQLDWPMLAAIAASSLPLAVYGAPWDYERASRSSPVDFWSWLVSPMLLSLVMVMMLPFVWGWLAGRKPRLLTITPDNDTFIAAMLCSLPVVVALFSLDENYALAAVLGVSVLTGAGVDILRRGIPGTAGVAIAALLLPALTVQMLTRNAPVGRHVSYEWSEAVNVHAELPIVYAASREFPQAWYNAPGAALRSRLTVLLDAAGDDRPIMDLNRAMPMPVSSYVQFKTSRQAFYAVDALPRDHSRLLPRLMRDGAQLVLQGVYGETRLYLVTWPAGG
jgi:hypothetical protein